MYTSHYFTHYTTHCSLMQLVVLLLGIVNHQFLLRQDFRLQETRNNPLSFASANSSTSLLAPTQYVPVRKIHLVVH
jgi:hypothetical protein